MSSINYIVKTGDTWHGIAFQAYGDATAFPEILAANPMQPVSEPLPGSRILIPIKTTEAVVQANTSALPVWKR